MNAEDLFTRYFLPLYPADAGADLGRARATDVNPGGNASVRAHLDDTSRRFVANASRAFGHDIGLDGSDASVHRLGAAFTGPRRDAWAAEGAPGSAENTLFNVVVHAAAYVGGCVVANHSGVWSVRRPLWESVVRLRSRAGECDLAVFHWCLKSLADDAVGQPERGRSATLGDRYRAHVEVPCMRPEDLPVLVTEPRRLPRLQAPTYARLHQYLRKHLPEVRELGEHFPDAARMAELGLRWMDFHVLGSGRCVLVAAAGQSGLHLFWLGAHGFEKSVFLAGDPSPEPVVRVHDDRLTAATTEAGAPRVHEMLWWGP